MATAFYRDASVVGTTIALLKDDNGSRHRPVRDSLSIE